MLSTLDTSLTLDKEGDTQDAYLHVTFLNACLYIYLSPKKAYSLKTMQVGFPKVFDDGSLPCGSSIFSESDEVCDLEEMVAEFARKLGCPVYLSWELDASKSVWRTQLINEICALIKESPKMNIPS